MFRCAQCGAPLDSPSKGCLKCKDSEPLLPTLQGFGDEPIDDFKTLMTAKPPEHSLEESESDNKIGPYTTPLVSPIPQTPYDDFSSSSEFKSNDQTEVVSRHASEEFLDMDAINEEENIDFTVSEHNDLILDEDSQFIEGEFEPLQPNQTKHSLAAPSVVSSPPPVPPPATSIGGPAWRGVVNPFSPKSQVTNYWSIWFDDSLKATKVKLDNLKSLVPPLLDFKISSLVVSDEHFFFDDTLNHELWRPVTQRIQIDQDKALRSAGIILRLVNMTIDATEVISQPSVAVWQVRPNQEQVFYGAFNLFEGVSRVGGLHCEIALPFLHNSEHLFTLECDRNGILWCLPNSGHEVWSLIQTEERLAYGSIVAIQGQLFTLVKT